MAPSLPCEDGIYQRVNRVFIRWMYYHPGRLVDDQEIVILVEYGGHRGR
jgi:hypothetical protein